MQDAASLVATSLQETAPQWQQHGQAHALTEPAGSIVDGNVHSMSPAIYRRGHTTDNEGELSRGGTALEHSVSILSGQFSSRRGGRESSASGKDASLSFRSENDSRPTV